jgi:hypothetical protein
MRFFSLRINDPVKNIDVVYFDNEGVVHVLKNANIMRTGWGRFIINNRHIDLCDNAIEASFCANDDFEIPDTIGWFVIDSWIINYERVYYDIKNEKLEDIKDWQPVEIINKYKEGDKIYFSHYTGKFTIASITETTTMGRMFHCVDEAGREKTITKHSIYYGKDVQDIDENLMIAHKNQLLKTYQRYMFYKGCIANFLSNALILNEYIEDKESIL